MVDIVVYFIFGFAACWVLCGVVTIYTIAKPHFDGDSVDIPPFFICLIVLFFGPFSQVVVNNSKNEVMFNHR